MEAKLGVLIIHGVGWQTKGFAKAMIGKLERRISNHAEIRFKPIFWHEILSHREDKLMKLFPDGKTPHRLKWIKRCIRWGRKKVAYLIGDVTGYQYMPDMKDEEHEAHVDIHKVVHKRIADLRRDLDNEDKPVIVIAHSIGSVIMSDYIWDRQHWDKQKKQRDDPYGKTPFERMETLVGFITCGSPIPLYAIACDPTDRIKFPPENLADNLRKDAKWLNFFYLNDVLGWPLQKLGSSYGDTEDFKIEDIKIKGGIPGFCHTKYWKDDNFTEPVAQYISKILSVS
jgi:hypothetical protein